MRIVKTDYLNKKQLKDIRKITAECNAADGTHYGVPDDADLYAFLYDDERRMLALTAVYGMGDLYEGREIIELSAFTRPGKRRQGYFRDLYDSLETELDGAAVRFSVYANDSAAETLTTLHAKHDHDELMLQKSIADETDDAESLCIDYEAGRAYNEFCECGFRCAAGNAYVFAVMTYENYQRKGYAKKMLRELFGALSRKGISSVTLQVSSENVPALKLYESLGMHEIDRLCMYYCL